MKQGKICSVLLLLFFFFSPAMAQASEIIAVIIQGIDDRLYDNVEANLTIYQKKEQKGLSDREIKRMHRSAKKEIKKALEPFGYYTPTIVSDLKNDNGQWLVNYIIDTGKPVRVNNIEITIATHDLSSDTVDEIVASFPLDEDDILEHELYTSGKKKIIQHILALGFLDAEYKKNELRVNRSTGLVDIILSLESGPRYLFGKTRFDQSLMESDFLQRFVQYKEGEPFSPDKLSQLQRILYKTNYFSQVVVKAEVEDNEGLFVPIAIDLSPPRYFNRYSFGLGYATDNGMRGTISWDNGLFSRRGHTVSSELKLAERENSLNFIYGVPIRNPRFDRVLFGATYDDEIWDDTDTRLFNVGLSFEHSGKKYKYGWGMELRDEKYQVGDTSGDSFLPVSHLSWSLVVADDLLYTNNGLFLSAIIKSASEDFFGDTSFVQGHFSGKAITTPVDDFRLIGRLTFGATSLDSIDDLPPSLRFYAGGDQSVRGYGYKELGPKDGSDTVIGGRYLMFGSIEAEKVVSGNWSLAAFLDVGNAMDDLATDLKEGVGVGVRYRLPFGQIRMDLASAISEDGGPFRLHITVGGDL